MYPSLQSQTSETNPNKRHEDSKIGQMLLQEYDITFVHIRGKDNILADAISRLCTIDIYEEAIETQHSPITQTTTTQLDQKVEQIHHVDSSQSPKLLNMNSITLYTLQKQDKFYKNKVRELHSGIDSTFYLNTDSILKQTEVINNLEICTTVVPLALTHTLLHEFHNCRGHQGCTRTLNLLKRKCWWKGMRRDIKYHISPCITCSKNLPNISCHPQLHLEIPKVPFICIAIDTIGKLPAASSGNRYALTCISLLTSYIIGLPMPDKTSESVVEAYLSGILSRAKASMVCLLDSGSELKNNQMNTVLKQLGIKCIYSNPYRPQGNSHIENIHKFLKRTLTMFLSSLHAEWDKILPFACYYFNSTPTADDLESPFFLIHGRDLLEGCAGLFGSDNIRYMVDDKGLILFTKLHKLWLSHAKSLQENRLLKTEALECYKHFKSHEFKVGQLVAVKNHLRNMFDTRFVSDYRIVKIINECTILIEGPDGKTRKININDAKPVSAITSADNTLQEFKQSMLKKEHTHPYTLHSSSM